MHDTEKKKQEIVSMKESMKISLKEERRKKNSYQTSRHRTCSPLPSNMRPEEERDDADHPMVWPRHP
jgi:hypothetical protein